MYVNFSHVGHAKRERKNFKECLLCTKVWETENFKPIFQREGSLFFKNLQQIPECFSDSLSKVYPQEVAAVSNLQLKVI